MILPPLADFVLSMVCHVLVVPVFVTVVAVLTVALRPT